MSRLRTAIGLAALDLVLLAALGGAGWAMARILALG